MEKQDGKRMKQQVMELTLDQMDKVSGGAESKWIICPRCKKPYFDGSSHDCWSEPDPDPVVE